MYIWPDSGPFTIFKLDSDALSAAGNVKFDGSTAWPAARATRNKTMDKQLAMVLATVDVAMKRGEEERKWIIAFVAGITFT